MNRFHPCYALTALSPSLGAALLLLGTLMASCGTIDLPDEPPQKEKPHKVTIHTRAVTPESVTLPIEVVAFSEGGQYVSHQRLTKAEDKLTLSLAEGRYRLVAFSGVGAYTPQFGLRLPLFCSGYSTQQFFRLCSKTEESLFHARMF